MLLTTRIATMPNSSMLIWTMTLMVPVLLLLVVWLLILIVMMRWLPSTPVLLKFVTVSMITVTV